MVALLGLFTLIACTGVQAIERPNLPKPDGKPADMTKPVQVFILLGQSNMVGMGAVAAKGKHAEVSLENAVKKDGLYPYLVDSAGNWITRKDVRNVFIMSGKLQVNDWMSPSNRRTLGPEYGIGNVLGTATSAPVMVLKSCIGNRSLGWDLLPPGSKQYEYDGQIYAGYKDSPLSWPKGTEPKKIGWYAGKQYDTDVAGAKQVLADLDKYYPGAKGYEIAGFFFWQGDKDRYKEAHAKHYEENLVRFIKQLRKDFNAPKAKFVVATLGQTDKDNAKGTEKLILDAQMAVDGNTGKYPEFKGNVATVYTHPLSQGGASNGHYNGNAKTYMDIGLAMGEAMLNLLKQ